jgi:Ser/Thr protein kinase RdoA (MazF antagonist)
MVTGILVNNELALRALANFPILARQVKPLRQSDNLTWRVEAQDGRFYLLRIHHSVTPALAGYRQQPEMIHSELEWLSALGEIGQKVQRPVKSRQGDWVATLTLQGRPVPCTLLSWLEGETYEPGEEVRPSLIGSYARLAALLHAHAATWLPPASFVRPDYDVSHFENLFKTLHGGVEANLIDAEDWGVLRRVNERLLRDIEASRQVPEQWGLIHADLHSGNLLVQGNEILAIDFSLCGFGSFLFDLSIALVAGVPAAQRDDFIQAYRRYRPLPTELIPLLDAYGLAGVLTYCAFQVGNPNQWEWLTNRIPRLAAGECRKYLNGQLIYLAE